MKRMNLKKLFAVAAGVLTLGLSSVVAQEEEAASESPFSMGADVVTNYVWRGVKFGGPSVQPYVELGLGDFAIGAWGSFALTDDSPMENDYYLSYAIGDLSLGLTDYYYQGPLFEFSDSAGSHAVEVNLGYTLGGLGIAANYIVNEAGGAASAGSDMYFELTYSFDNFDIFAGAGDGWHTSDGEFALCNVGISTSGEVSLGTTKIPVFGQVIVNPEAEASYLVVGFSF